MSLNLSSLVFSSPENDYKLLSRQFMDATVKQYGNAQYAELPVLLAALRSLSMIHQQNHWCVKGDKFYGDHQLFMRLYEETDAEIDKLAEKTIGLASTGFVCLKMQLQHMDLFVNLFDKLNSNDEESTTSYQAELTFIALCDLVMKSLRQQGLLTSGVEQLVGDMVNLHEDHIYLLKQRYQR
jgi:DNA-binding ferritin-like protein